MKDIKELADQIGAEVWPDTVRCITDLRDFAQRLIAAYVEGQEPVAWNKKIRNSVDDLLAQAGYAKDSSARHQLSMMNFDAAPPLTEPAPQGTVAQPTKVASALDGQVQTSPACAAPTPEEVREMVERLYSDLDGGPSGWAKQEAADMIERLAAINTNLNSENALLLKWKLEGVPEGCVVVPMEPTEAMCQAASARCHHPQALYKTAYKAMIAAGEVKP